jgi:hypothetical protein
MHICLFISLYRDFFQINELDHIDGEQFHPAVVL